MITPCRFRFALAACLLLSLSLGAQPQAVNPPPAAEGTDFERLIYLPYKNLKAVLDDQKATVFMPYAKFLTLWDAYRPQAAAGKPRVDAVLTEAKYVGTVEQDSAKIKVELTVRVLKEWAELPVQFGEAAIGKITSAGDKVLLQATGNGKYVFLLPEVGVHKVELDLVARVHTSPDGRSLEFPVPPASVTSVDLTVPAADQAVELVSTDSGKGALVEPAEAPANTTHVTAKLGATERIAARWRPRVSTAPVMELLASAQTLLDIRVADGLVHTQATLTYQVQRGQLDQLRILVPPNHRVLDVSSPSLKSWKATPEEKQQVLVIDLLGSDAKTVTVQVHTEQPAPTGTFSVAGIADDGTVRGVHATDGVRETGLIVLSQAADLTLAVEKQTGVVRVEPAEAPEALRRPDAQFYRYYSPKFDLQVQAKPVEPRVLVHNDTALTFADDELRLDATLQYTIERAGLFELRLKIPPGLVIDRVDCPAMKEFQAPAGQDVLIVTLSQRTAGSLAVTVSGHQPLDADGKEAFPLPVLEPQAVERETGSLRVLAPEAIEILVDEQGLQGAQPSRDAAAQANLPPAMRLASAWTYTRRPLAIPVTTSRRPTRLSAAVGTLIDVRQDTVNVTTNVNFNVEYAGIDTFRIALPKAASESVQIESGNPATMPIKQKQQAEPENDWVVWTVIFQRELTGPVPLVVRYDLKPQKDGTTARLSIAPVRALSSPGTGEGAEIPLAALTGELSVQKDRSLSIAAESKEMEPIDVRDLKSLAQDGYLAFRYFRQPEKFDQPLSVSLTATLHELQKVADTVVLKAVHEAVITEEASALYRCRFLLKTSERQRLPLDLPLAAELLDAQVAGRKVDLELQPGEPTGDWRGHFVNVGRTGRSEDPFVISVVFRTGFKSPPLAGKTGGQLELIFPRIPLDAQGTSVPVLETRAAVWLPKEYHLVGKPQALAAGQLETQFASLWQPWVHWFRGVHASTSDSQHLDAWFGSASSGLFDFTPAGHSFAYQKLGTADRMQATYWPMVIYTWIVSIAVFVVGLVLAWTSWENRLWIVLVAGFLGVLLALNDYDLALHVLSAARFGLAAALALWILSLLSHPRMASDIDLRTQGAPLAAVIPPPGIFERPSKAEPPKPT